MRRSTLGKKNTPVYRSWKNMRQRCRNPRIPNYKDYGGRGIFVCERWRNFQLFYKDMGDPPKGYSIDRIDNNGNYEPGNCRWASRKTQGLNKRTNRSTTFSGRTQTLSQWAAELKIDQSKIAYRLNMGWSAELALSTTKERLYPNGRGFKKHPITGRFLKHYSR